MYIYYKKYNTRMDPYSHFVCFHSAKRDLGGGQKRLCGLCATGAKGPRYWSSIPALFKNGFLCFNDLVFARSTTRRRQRAAKSRKEKIMSGIETITTMHLVKGEDLNHHGTLYAGRGVDGGVRFYRGLHGGRQ